MKQYYHGRKNTGPYFEGWYFKLRARDGRTLALIPAVHLDDAGNRTASLQVVTGEKTWYIPFPGDCFSAEESTLNIRLGENSFSRQGIRLQLRQGDLTLEGGVSFGMFSGLRRDVMGPFRWVPGMQCVHDVISMKHSIQGWIRLNGSILDFRGGTGYIESDRGRSFPDAYLWCQGNWQGGSMVVCVATVPFGPGNFTGCVCALVQGGTEYRLATYRGARVIRWSETGAVIRQGPYTLQIQLPDSRGQPLRAPVRGAMARTIRETLCGPVGLQLWREKELLLDRMDPLGSFEFAGGTGPA